MSEITFKTTEHARAYFELFLNRGGEIGKENFRFEQWLENQQIEEIINEEKAEAQGDYEDRNN